MTYQDFPKLSKAINELEEMGLRIFSTDDDGTFYKVYLKQTRITAVVIILQYEKRFGLLKQYVFGLDDLEAIVKDEGFRMFMKQAIKKQEGSE